MTTAQEQIITVFDEVLSCGRQNYHYSPHPLYAYMHCVCMYGGDLSVVKMEIIRQKLNAVDIKFSIVRDGILFLIIGCV